MLIFFYTTDVYFVLRQNPYISKWFPWAAGLPSVAYSYIAKSVCSFAFVKAEEGQMMTVLHCCTVFLMWCSSDLCVFTKPIPTPGLVGLATLKMILQSLIFVHLCIWNNLSQYFHTWLQSNSSLHRLQGFLFISFMQELLVRFYSEIVNSMLFSLRINRDLWYYSIR